MKTVFERYRLPALFVVIFLMATTSTMATALADSDEGPSSSLLRRSVYDAGRWSVGMDANFSMTTSTVELIETEGSVSDSTLFMRIDPWVSIGVIERLHVGLITGVITRRLAQDTLDPTTDLAAIFQPMAQYYFPISRRLALMTQLAMGAYIGRSQRSVPTDPDNPDRLVTEDTRTRGFILTAGLGMNYRLTEGLQLRFGMAFNGIWGREAVDSIDEDLSASTTNLQTTAGIRYTF